MKANGPTKIFAKYLSDMKFEDLPTNVITQAKNCIIDFIGVGLAGSLTERGRLVGRFASSFPNSDESCVLVTRRKASALNAAFANGVVGHVLELDDGNRFAMGHPGVTTIPAAMADGRKNGGEWQGSDLGHSVWIRGFWEAR